MYKIFTKLYTTSLWLLIVVFTGCESNNEPEPVDCASSNLKLAFTSSDPTSCGANDGSISAMVSGGGAPYQFALDAQAYKSNSNFTGLGAGTYQLKIKDSNGCERTTSVILKPFGSTLSATMVSADSGCKLSNGSITVAASGGTVPYSYSLNNGAPSTENTFNSLSSGSYLVKVTDNTGCSITETVKVLSGISFNSNIKSIIDTKCAISGCHVTGGAAPGSFTSFSNIQSNASAIKSKTQSGEMPKNGAKLPQSELDAIACWVDDGAPNN